MIGHLAPAVNRPDSAGPRFCATPVQRPGVCRDPDAGQIDRARDAVLRGPFFPVRERSAPASPRRAATTRCRRRLAV